MSVSEQNKPEEKNAFWETIVVLFQAFLLAAVIRTVLLQPFTIPSGSMIPTLLVGDYLLVNKFSYGYSKYSLPFSPNLFEGRIFASEPERGDIAVFRFPPNPRGPPNHEPRHRRRHRGRGLRRGAGRSRACRGRPGR